MNSPLGKKEVKLVSTDWVKKNLDKYLILDTQPNVHDYISEHLPGALYLNENHFRIQKNGVPAKFVSKETIQEVFRQIGIEKDTGIIVYTGEGVHKGWGDGLEQTMVAYTLARFGHEEIYVMDGGLEKWKKENKELEKSYEKEKKSNYEVKVRKDYFIGIEELKSKKEEKDVVLLDARPRDLYEGQGPWQKPGHIPGAINLPWKKLMQDNPRTLRPVKEIKSLLEKKDLTKDKTIICSCGTGREATNEFLLFNFYLNYPEVKLFEGSFTEWCSDPNNPTVTGEDPR